MPTIHTPTPTAGVAIASSSLLNTVNEWRKTQNLASFSPNNVTCTIAEARLNQLKNNFSHDGFEALTSSGAFPAGSYAENIAKDFDSDQSIVDTWSASPIHHDNMAGNYTYSCTKNDGGITVEIFASY
jgi:uncharacterized protein YkwD